MNDFQLQLKIIGRDLRWAMDGEIAEVDPMDAETVYRAFDGLFGEW